LRKKKSKKESSNTLGSSDFDYGVFEQEAIKWLYEGNVLWSNIKNGTAQQNDIHHRQIKKHEKLHLLFHFHTCPSHPTIV
jgi:hypothetical protein